MALAALLTAAIYSNGDNNNNNNSGAKGCLLAEMATETQSARTNAHTNIITAL